MPVLEIYSPLFSPPDGLLELLCTGVSEILQLPTNQTWAIWNEVPKQNFCRPGWDVSFHQAAPLIFLHCKDTYTVRQINAVMRRLQSLLVAELNCEPESVFIAVRRVYSAELLVRNQIWEAQYQMSEHDIVVHPIGVVHTARTEMLDDYWGAEISVIELDSTQFTEEAVAGLSDFSHIEVLFFLHRVPLDEITTKARHPRGRPDWPKVGIFAQRAKGRPNRIGVSRCRLIRVEGLTITTQGLDAIAGTPVLDIKPYFDECGPRGEVKQPGWATEIMKHYYDEAGSQIEK